MKISYLVTCSNETNTLDELLSVLAQYKDEEDEIIVLQDGAHHKTFNETYNIIHTYIKDIRYFVRDLDNNYGAQKNYGTSMCLGDWIFQIDGDERPNPVLILNVKNIINSNPDAELFFVPRINDFKGVTQDDANKWGWKLTEFAGGRLIVNWPDFQGRLYKNNPKRIKWDRRLHEKITGHTQYAIFPAEYDVALYHDKTIEKQRETNLRYNKLFSQQENQGHNVFEHK